MAVVEIRRVVCPVDFSDFSRRALDYAVAIARWYSSRLTVLHVHSVMMPSIAQLAGLAPGRMEALVLSPADRKQLHEQLKGLTSAEALRDIPVEFSVAEGDVAAEQDSGLIVIGARGAGVVKRLFIGSTAEHVVRQAVCPVLACGQVAEKTLGT